MTIGDNFPFSVKEATLFFSLFYKNGDFIIPLLLSADIAQNVDFDGFINHIFA
jgi:hypothetical protein